MQSFFDPFANMIVSSCESFVPEEMPFLQGAAGYLAVVLLLGNVMESYQWRHQGGGFVPQTLAVPRCAPQVGFWV